MIEIICTSITGIVTIVCAILAKGYKKQLDINQKALEKSELRSKQRIKESQLSLAMISATMKLTVGVAMALKQGHCNGEVEEGLKAVHKADEEYNQFLNTIAIDHLLK